METDKPCCVCFVSAGWLDSRLSKKFGPAFCDKGDEVSFNGAARMTGQKG